MTVPQVPGRRLASLPETGLGDLLRALAALQAGPAAIGAVAEILGITEPPESATEEGEEDLPGAPVPSSAPPRPSMTPSAPIDTAVTPTGDQEGELAATASYLPPRPLQSGLPARPLAEVLPKPRPLKPHQNLFAAGRSRALLALISSRRRPEGEIDEEAAVSLLASGQFLADFPRRWINSSTGSLELAIDTGPGMDPYLHDVDLLTEQLARITGPDRLTLRWFRDYPVLGPGALAWDNDLELAPCPYDMPPPGALLVAVTTFGARGRIPPASTALEHWQELFHASVRGRNPLVVLTPLAPDRYPAGLPRQLAIVTWDRTTRMQQVLNIIAAASAVNARPGMNSAQDMA